MRQKQITGDKKMQRAARKEPLMEGIQKKRRSPNFFTRMSANELISYAKKIIKENGIKDRKELSKKDGSLYNILRKRKLLDIIMPKKCRGAWTSMSDEDVLFYAKKLIEEKSIPTSNILRKIDGSLFNNLLKRELLEVVFPDKRVCRKWISKTNEEVIEYANDSISKNKIKNRIALEKLDPGLVRVLRYRGLLDIVIPDKLGRQWSKMSDEKIISYTENLMEKKGITTRPELKEEDTGLYRVLYVRGLMDAVLPSSKRDWLSISDKGVIQYTKDLMRENGIKNISRLQKADGGLYQVLRARNLLDAVFADIEHAKKTEAVKQVVDAMKEF